MITAAIVGGGIGGLAAAVALRKAGLHVEVYEQAPELKEIGAGLAVWANGVTALRHLGLGEAVAATTVSLHVTGTRTAFNPRIDLIDMQPTHKRVGASSVAMHRGHLLQILLDACETGTVHANKQVREATQTSDRVTVRFSDGAEASSDILIAADGARSAIRQQIVGGAAASYAGYSTYRSVLNDFDPGAGWPRNGMIRTLSCGEYFGLGEIAPRSYLWFLTKNGPLHRPEPRGRKAAVRDVVGSWAPPIPGVVEATAEEDILLHPVFKLRPLTTWRSGRIVLLGDAAHPIEPALGMGASLAMEDAVVLGNCLREERDPDRAFRRYEERRMPRVRKLVRWAAILARSEQISNPLMCRMRDIWTRLVPEGMTRLLAERAFDFSYL